MAGGAFVAGEEVLLKDLPPGSGADGLKGTLVREAGKGKWVVRVAGEERSRIVAARSCRKLGAPRAEGYSIVGSWDEWSSHRMSWRPESRCYEYQLRLASGQPESFRILADGDWDRCLYPDCERANPYEDHCLLGPDVGGLDAEWMVGLHQEDQAASGSVYNIRLLVSADGTPERVTWEPQAQARRSEGRLPKWQQLQRPQPQPQEPPPEPRPDAETEPQRPLERRRAGQRQGCLRELSSDLGSAAELAAAAAEVATVAAAADRAAAALSCGRRSRSRARGFEAWQTLRDASAAVPADGGGGAAASDAEPAAAEGAAQPPAEPVADAGPLLPGDVVEICGLRSRLGPSLNGQRGLVTRRLEGGDRLEVLVGHDVLPTRFVSVRSANLLARAGADGEQLADLDRFLEKPLLCTDAAGIPRGGCRKNGGCRSWVSRQCTRIYFARPDEKDTVDADDEDGQRSSAALAGENYSAQEYCERCGCSAQDHESLKQWLDQVRSRVKAIQAPAGTGAWPPSASLEATRVPAAAAEWGATAVALFALSGGRFDPSSCGREPEEASGNQQRSLISVICPTDERKHMVHGLLYECFRLQTHEARELIVVDVGSKPCEFFSARALEDPRIVYRHFPAKAREEEAWPCGLKRNIACHLARGDIIVHFNAGDIYAPGYLAYMHSELTSAAAVPGGGALRPAAAHLTQWHAVNLSKQSRCTQLMWVDMRHRGSRKQQIMSGLGFTFAYTPAAWEGAPFAHVEAPEDCRFMEALFKKGVPIRVLQPKAPAAKREGLAAHCFERESGASGEDDELASLMQLCELQDDVPEGFRRFWPFVRQLVTRLNAEEDVVAPDILQIEGSVYLCAQCMELVASLEHLVDCTKHTADRRPVEVGQFSKADGARKGPGQGRCSQVTDSAWFPGWLCRSALCGGCGDRLGYHYERGAHDFWALEWRRLLERRPPGSEPKPPGSKKKSVACPAGHALHRFANPGQYGCDTCALRGVYNIPPRGTWLWGCSKCDFDMCVGCWEGKRRSL